MGSKHRLTWTEVAQRDVEELLEYVAERDDLETAVRLCERLRPSAEALRTMPQRCRVVPELRAVGHTEFRELILKPFRLVFWVRPREVVVVGVFDGRRRLEEVLAERLLDR